MYKKYILGIATALTLTLSSCVNDDTDFSDIINRDATIERVSFDETALSESDTFASEYADDYVENSEFSRTVYIKFNGTSAEITGETSAITSTVDGAHITITPSKKKMLFVLQGTTTDGGVKFYGDNKYEVLLDGVSINNPTGPAINSQSKKRMFLVLNDNTENTLSDGTSYTAFGDEDMKGTVFAEGKVLLSGNGKLSITSNYKHSIASDDYVLVRPGVNLSITNNTASGIKSKDGVTILGGVLNISTTADGGRGISCDSCVTVRGGRTTIISSGASIIEDNDTTSATCIKCDGEYQQLAGTVRLQSIGSGGKGINTSSNALLTGGTLYAVTFGDKDLSSPKALKSDGSVKIATTTYLYSKSSNAYDAANGIEIQSGYIIKEHDKHLFNVVSEQ